MSIYIYIGRRFNPNRLLPCSLSQGQVPIGLATCDDPRKNRPSTSIYIHLHPSTIIIIIIIIIMLVNLLNKPPDFRPQGWNQWVRKDCNRPIHGRALRTISCVWTRRRCRAPRPRKPKSWLRPATCALAWHRLEAFHDISWYFMVFHGRSFNFNILIVFLNG